MGDFVKVTLQAAQFAEWQWDVWELLLELLVELSLQFRWLGIINDRDLNIKKELTLEPY